MGELARKIIWRAKHNMRHMVRIINTKPHVFLFHARLARSSMRASPSQPIPQQSILHGCIALVLPRYRCCILQRLWICLRGHGEASSCNDNVFGEGFFKHPSPRWRLTCDPAWCFFWAGSGYPAAHTSIHWRGQRVPNGLDGVSGFDSVWQDLRPRVCGAAARYVHVPPAGYCCL